MVSPSTSTSSNSSAFFGSDDTSFLIALGDAVLPGDLNPQESVQITSSSPPTPVSLSRSSLEPPPCAQPASNVHLHIDTHDNIRTPPSARLRLTHSPLTPSNNDEPPLLPLKSPPPAQSRYKKRAHSISSDDEYPALVQSPDNLRAGTVSSYLDSDTFGASRFGEFGEYMSRKRAKLQIQNAEMGDIQEPTTSNSKLFNGLSIYVGQLVPTCLIGPYAQSCRSMVGQSPPFRNCVS